MSCDFCENVAPQLAHPWDFTFSWVRICCGKWPLKVREQMWQKNALTFSWKHVKCFFNASGRTNDLPQRWHVKSLTFKWLLTCNFRFTEHENEFGHCVQRYFFMPVWLARCCVNCKKIEGKKHITNEKNVNNFTYYDSHMMIMTFNVGCTHSEKDLFHKNNTCHVSKVMLI